MAVTINAYDQVILLGLQKNADFDADTFKCELHNTLAFNQAHDERADVSASALATGNGYTNPGQNLASVTCTQSGGVTTWDAADMTWTASGGSIGPATDAVIYDDTLASPADALLFDIDFGASETAGNGTDFKITFNASGIFTVS